MGMTAIIAATGREQALPTERERLPKEKLRVTKTRQLAFAEVVQGLHISRRNSFLK